MYCEVTGSQTRDLRIQASSVPPAPLLRLEPSTRKARDRETMMPMISSRNRGTAPIRFWQFLLLAACLLRSAPGEAQRRPINSHATPEARQLLKYLYHIQGKKTLSGMHNVLGRMSVNTDRVQQLTGKYPAIWGGDFGFADSTHDIDNIRYRPLLVPEIKRQHARGAIIVLCYHQANPAIGEPCDFKGGIISQLTDAQWQELLTPGTPLYQKWAAQMDLLAWLPGAAAGGAHPGCFPALPRDERQLVLVGRAARPGKVSRRSGGSFTRITPSTTTSITCFGPGRPTSPIPAWKTTSPAATRWTCWAPTSTRARTAPPTRNAGTQPCANWRAANRWASRSTAGC